MVPILAVVALRVFFPRKMTWWEFVIPLAVSAVVIFVGKLCADKIAVMDTEYWGGWMTKAVYFEPWDEEVPCSHARYRTETRTTTDSKGNVSTYTEQVFDGYEHPYDVSNHGPKWQIEDSNEFVFDISQSEFERLADLFRSRRKVELNRDYHSIDGDAFVADWPGDRETLQPVTSVHSYENRVAKSRSLYSYMEVDPRKTPVFDYPDVDNYTVSSVVSRSSWPGSAEIDKVNALLGASKKVRVWVVVWEGALDRSVALDQEAYWKGGNKNELVVCVNVNSIQDPTVNWCEVFSWSNSEDLKVAIESFVSVDNTRLDMTALAHFLEREIADRWEKRNWHDFDYLDVQPPTWAIVLIWVFTCLATAFSSFFCLTNDYECGALSVSDGYRGALMEGLVDCRRRFVAWRKRWLY